MIDQIYLPDCPHLPACPTFLRSFFISHPNFENTLISCAFLSKSWNDRLKASNDFKNKQKSVWRNAFWYSKVCILWKFIQYTIHGDETQMLKKNSFGQNKQYKKCSYFFFRELQLTTVSLLICDSCMSWNTRFVSLKLCEIFHFQFRLYISINTKYRLLDVNTS